MTGWQEGRATAYALGVARAEPVRTVATGSANGLTTALDIRSPSALPPFDNSAMDGWAVAGDAPWSESEPILAGETRRLPRLRLGEARPIATGAPVPPATVTVIRTEDAARRPGDGATLIEPLSAPQEGRNIRRRGEELVEGEVLVVSGTRITPPLLGLLAAAGVTRLPVRGPVPFAFIAIGDELCDGSATGSQINDSLSSALPAALEALGGRCVSRRRVVDRPDPVAEAISAASAPVIVTTGGTAHGPADPVRQALGLVRADVVLDGLDVRPGRSVILSSTRDATILSLPGNPFAAFVDALLLGWPLLAGRLGAPQAQTRPCSQAFSRADGGAHVIACREDAAGTLVPVAGQGPNMLRGIAAATHLVVTHGEGGGAQAIRLPWC